MVLVFWIANFFTNKTSLANEWMSFSSSNTALLKKNIFHFFFQQNLNGHANLIGYVDSSVTLLDGGIHEVLLLMPYHKTTVLQMMNDKLDSGFSQEEILKIFCDICKAVSR